jgi:aspartyl protease family protein
VLLLALVAFAAHMRSGRNESPVAGATGAGSASQAACDDPLLPGAWTSDVAWDPGGSSRSQTRIVNSSGRDRVVDLLDGRRTLISFALPAGQESTHALPTGTYQWQLRHGAAWCDRLRAFVREVTTTVDGPLEVVASSRLTVHLDEDPDAPGRLRIHTSDEPVVSIHGRGAVTEYAVMRPDQTLLLQRSDNGHYHLDGSIDGMPIRFLLDTGAGSVAVPEATARRLGHHRGREVSVQTAGGPAVGYEFVARELIFGPFAASDVRVIALPNLSQPLLGMSVLGAMSLTQTPQGLVLAAPR